jgi:hypothetical protein
MNLYYEDMTMVCAIEQRISERSVVKWPVSIWNPKASRFYNGRSIDVSTEGALIAIPMHLPVCEGQVLEINFPRMESLAKDKGSFARIKNAKVVRIDRSDTLISATIKVAVLFNTPAQQESMVSTLFPIP